MARPVVLAAHKRTREAYGAVRLHKELVFTGHSISFWQVKMLQKEMDIVCKVRRRHRHKTDSNRSLPVAPHLVSRDFTANYCNYTWIHDITYIPTEQGWLYFTGIKYSYSKEIVGLSSEFDDLSQNAGERY